MKSASAGDEEVMQKIDALMKDPEKWREYIASHAERALKHWRKRWRRRGDLYPYCKNSRG